MPALTPRFSSLRSKFFFAKYDRISEVSCPLGTLRGLQTGLQFQHRKMLSLEDPTYVPAVLLLQKIFAE